jgi:hypothetical protein
MKGDSTLPRFYFHRTAGPIGADGLDLTMNRNGRVGQRASSRGGATDQRDLAAAAAVGLHGRHRILKNQPATGLQMNGAARPRGGLCTGGDKRATSDLDVAGCAQLELTAGRLAIGQYPGIAEQAYALGLNFDPWACGRSVWPNRARTGEDHGPGHGEASGGPIDDNRRVAGEFQTAERQGPIRSSVKI